MNLDIVGKALSIYDDVMYIYYYFWVYNPEITSTNKFENYENSKRKAFIKLKTEAIICHDKILIEGNKK